MRPIGGAIADRIGGTKTLATIYGLVAILLLAVSAGNLSATATLIVFIVGMSAFGIGNGAVFQLLPQRFGRDVGLMTGLVGMTGGVGGFYLAVSLGYAQQLSGSYAFGFMVFAALALAAFAGIATVRTRWRREISDTGLLAGARI